MAKARYSKQEFARRGDTLFQDQILPQLNEQDAGKFVAIDIETGQFAVDGNEVQASAQVKARRPEAQIWICRVGSRYARHFAPRFR